MENEIIKSPGQIKIADEVIAVIAGVAASECYGLVAMSPQKITHGIGELVGKEFLSKGIKIRSNEAGVTIDLYVVVGYGVKISEVARNVAVKVKHAIELYTSLCVTEVNVIVQGVQVMDR